MPGRRLHVGVLLGDPRLPYSFSAQGRFGPEELAAVRELESALEPLDGYSFDYFDDHDRLIDDLRGAELDLALNFCDTGYRNDWRRPMHVPALLEILEIPYTGATPRALYLARDKSLVRALAVNFGIPVPVEVFTDLRVLPYVLPERYPAVVKPNTGAGSFGMSSDCVVGDAREAEALMRRLAATIEPPEVLVQEFLTGPEYTLGLVGNPETGLTVLAPAEVDYGDLDADLPPVFTYEGKFDAASRYWQQLRHRRAELDEARRAKLVAHCARLYDRLGLRDYARFDFRAGDDGTPRLLDVNPSPVWHADSRFAMMAEWAGISYAELLRLILAAAVRRYGLA